MKELEVIIIGAGISGLSAAIYLHRQGFKVKLLEAEDRPGGRVKTDLKDGFRLDRGFQVLLTEYPEAKALLDYPSLELQTFVPGALILSSKGKYTIGDPIRHPKALWSTLTAPVSTLGDKWNILRLRKKLQSQSLDQIFSGQEIPSSQALHEYGMSSRIIQYFFKPFLGGIFLENDLRTSRRMFDFVYKMFSEGDTAVPRYGIEAIPQQLREQLPEDAITCDEKVSKIEGQKVFTEPGKTYESPAIILATQGKGIVENYMPQVKRGFQSVCNVYFQADKSPLKQGIIMLNAQPGNLVNNLVVMSEVSPNYAPPGKALISVSLNEIPDMDSQSLSARIRNELSQLLGDEAFAWKLIDIYPIVYALPSQVNVRDHAPESQLRLREGLYVCGDHLLNSSLNAAMKSGRLVAELIGRDYA